MSGHYANVQWTKDDGTARPKLMRPADNTKDQTYYLSGIKEASLSRVSLSSVIDRNCADQSYRHYSRCQTPLKHVYESLRPSTGSRQLSEQKAWGYALWARSGASRISWVCAAQATIHLNVFQLKSFVAQYILAKPGPVINLETGREVGKHNGLWRYTIGQGAKLPGMQSKMFVSRKDATENAIYIVPGS